MFGNAVARPLLRNVPERGETQAVMRSRFAPVVLDSTLRGTDILAAPPPKAGRRSSDLRCADELYTRGSGHALLYVLESIRDASASFGNVSVFGSNFTSRPSL